MNGVHFQRMPYPASWTIGDKTSDVEFGRALGTRTVLLRGSYWDNTDISLTAQDTAHSLLGATHIVLPLRQILAGPRE